MLAWFLMASAQAQTVIAVPGDHPTVYEAVLAAQNGDTIEIDGSANWERSVSQDVVVTKNLTFRGVNGKPALPRLELVGVSTTLDSVTLKGVQREAPDYGVDLALIVDGGTITMNAVALRSSPFGSYGVVSLSADVTVNDADATGFWGGPVFIPYGGSFTVNDGVFTGNIAGVHAIQDADVYITGGAYEGNWGYAGGDIAVGNTSLRDLHVSGATFTLSAGDYGGAIYAGTANVQITDCTFNSTFAWQGGGAVAVYGEHAPAGLLIDGATTFTDTYAASGGALLAANVQGAVVDGARFTRSYATDGGAALVTEGDLVFRDVVFEDNAAWIAGGALTVGGGDNPYYYYYPPGTGTVTGPGTGTGTGTGPYTYPYTTWYGDPPTPTSVVLQRTELSGIPGTTDALFGGCVQVHPGATLEVQGGKFHDCAADLGGGIYFLGDQLTIGEDPDLGGQPEFKDNTAVWGGAIDAYDGVVEVDGALFLGNSAGWGAALRGNFTDISVQHSWFSSNNATNKGTVDLSDIAGLSMWNNRFCDNLVENAGAIVSVTGGEGGPYKVHNNVFLANASDLGTALRYVPADWLGNVGPAVVIENNDFLLNDLATAVVVRGQVDFTNNIVAGHPIGFLLDQAPWNNALTGSHNLWFENGSISQGTDGFFPGPTAVTGQDPLFQGLIDGDCTSNLHLQPDSPARDTGHPNLTDPDGSRSDIGAFGGTGADLADRDGDGWFEDLDCDDGDPAIHPDALEIPYDQVDSDCDGADLCDGDGDGFDAVACGGTDCDDTDAKVNPAARDLPNDGLDNNCDGFQPTSWVAGGGGCGCATQPGGAPIALWPGLIALVALRRRVSSAARPG